MIRATLTATASAAAAVGAILLGAGIAQPIGHRIATAPSARAAAHLAAPFMAAATGAGLLFTVSVAAMGDAIDSNSRRRRSKTAL